MPGDGEIFPGIGGVVDDAEGSEVELGDDFKGKLFTKRSRVMVSNHEGDFSFGVIDPIDEKIGDVSHGGVKKIACDDDLLASGLVYEAGDASEVFRIISLRNGHSLGLEGGGLPEVNVRKDQRGMFGQKKGPLGEKVQLMVLVGDMHGYCLEFIQQLMRGKSSFFDPLGVIKEC